MELTVGDVNFITLERPVVTGSGTHQPHGPNRQQSGSELALPGTTDNVAGQSDCLNPEIETLLTVA